MITTRKENTIKNYFKKIKPHNCVKYNTNLNAKHELNNLYEK